MNEKILLTLMTTMLLLGTPVFAGYWYTYVKVSAIDGTITELNPVNNIVELPKSLSDVSPENVRTFFTGTIIKKWDGSSFGGASLQVYTKSCSLWNPNCDRIAINLNLANAKIIEMTENSLLLETTGNYDIRGPTVILKPKTVCFSSGNCYYYPDAKTISMITTGKLDSIILKVSDGKLDLTTKNNGVTFLSIEGMEVTSYVYS